MVKCACGCGQEIIGPKVGVPTGEGDFIAFIPEHHLGPQTALTAEGGEIRDNPCTPFQRERKEHPKFTDAQIRQIVKDHQRIRHRRNAVPVGKIAQMAGVKGSVSIGENPTRCGKCGCVREDTGCHREIRMGSTSITAPCQACIDWVGKGSVRKNADDGTINVHNSRVTEVRYVEAGTGEKYKHRLVRPVKMKVRGGKVIVPPMSVRPEGITQ